MKVLYLFLVCFYQLCNSLDALSGLYTFNGCFSKEQPQQLALDSPYTSTGTTIVGICCRDGVVLGADTRSTGGSIVMDKGKQKIRRISPYIFCAGAGTSADCDQIARAACHNMLLKNIDNELVEGAGVDQSSVVSAAAHSIANSLSRHSAGRQPSGVFILGGIDTWGPRLFQVGPDGIPARISFASLGSGSPNALAILEKFHHEISENSNHPSNDLENGVLNISVDLAMKVVKEAILAGIVNDLGSGSHVDICVITYDGAHYWRDHLLPMDPKG
jgi:20S proteasome subunit beta 2